MTTTRLTRTIRSSPEAVYRALIDPVAVQTWMVPDGMTSSIERFEAEVGGAFRISLTYDAPTTAGKSDDRTDTFEGRFVELDPGRRVVQVVEFETDDPSIQGEMTITYALRAIDGGTELALVKDVQKDVVTNDIEHIDLLLVRRGEKVTVEVSVVTEGESFPGTIHSVELQSLTVEALATAIPEHVTVLVLAVVIGYYVIGKVHHALHTPLMSVTNAISGIIVVGALLQIGKGDAVVTTLAFVATMQLAHRLVATSGR